MDWYKYFFEQLEGTGESFTGTHLYVALCRAIAISDGATKQDLKDLTRAFDEYKEDKYNEQNSSQLEQFAG